MVTVHFEYQSCHWPPAPRTISKHHYGNEAAAANCSTGYSRPLTKQNQSKHVIPRFGVYLMRQLPSVAGVSPLTIVKRVVLFRLLLPWTEPFLE